jgi:DNA-binding FadR family transcriptional regulator
VVLDSIGDILLRVREETWRKPAVIGLAYDAHGNILEAIVSRDRLGEQVAMLEHLEPGFEIWLETSQKADPSPETR